MAYKDLEKRRRTARAYRLKNKDKTRHRLKSFRGHISRLYSGMKGRVAGKNAKSPELYLGKSLLPKEVFWNLALESVEYKKLWVAWRESNYNRLLTPSVNRIDSTRGYDLDNIEFITAQDNCRHAHQGRTNYYRKVRA